jgi:UDP-glucose 4-epimerase
MTISLVTGGAGFIGSHVADHLLKMGHEVVILDDLSGGSLENVPHHKNCEFEEGSICDHQQVDALFRYYHPEYVFHLAAYAAEGLSHFARRFIYTNNVIGSANLINAAVNYSVKRFVFASSAAVYGEMTEVATEETVPDPIDPYGIAKLTIERDLQAASLMFDLDYTIFRCHNVFGPRQNLNDGYRNVVGIFIAQALKGQPMTIFGDGMQSRQFTYIDDIAPFIANCINVTGTICETFNIGADQPISVNGVAAWVATAINIRATQVKLPRRAEAQHVRTDHSKFKRVFGEREHAKPWEAIEAMATWAKTQTLREPKPFAAIEIEKNLPEAWRKLHVD